MWRPPADAARRPDVVLPGLRRLGRVVGQTGEEGKRFCGPSLVPVPLATSSKWHTSPPGLSPGRAMQSMRGFTIDTPSLPRRPAGRSRSHLSQEAPAQRARAGLLPRKRRSLFRGNVGHRCARAACPRPWHNGALPQRAVSQPLPGGQRWCRQSGGRRSGSARPASPRRILGKSGRRRSRDKCGSDFAWPVDDWPNPQSGAQRRKAR